MSRTLGTTDEGIARPRPRWTTRRAGIPDLMPDRAVIPLVIATAAGFTVGLIAAVLQLHGGAAVALGVAGGVAVMLAGAASVAGGDAPERDKTLIGALRGALAVGLFAFVFLGTLQFLRDGQIALALLLFALAGAYGLIISRLRWRAPEGEESVPLPERVRREQGSARTRGPAGRGRKRAAARAGNARDRSA